MRLREHPGILPSRIDILSCKPEALSIEEGYNVRDLTTQEALQELDELEELVLEHGIQTPLKVRFASEKIWIVEGHRRITVVNRLIAKFKDSSDKLPLPPRAPRGQTPLPPAEIAGAVEPTGSVSPEPATDLSGPEINKGGTNEWPSQVMERPGPPPPSTPQSRHGVLKDLVGALQPFAEYAEQNDLSARNDDDAIEVFVRDVKRAATVHARVTGGEG